MRYETVIFDLDGTLLDTLGDLTGAVNNALSRFSFSPLDREGVRRRIGDGLKVLMQRCFPADTDEATIQAAMQQFRSYYAEHLFDTTVPYPNMAYIVSALKQYGIQLAVATNKDEFLARKLTDRFFEDSFISVCGMCEGRSRKPAKDIPLAALSATQNSGKVLFVGDSHTDYLTAMECGFDFLGVSWGYGDCSGGVFTAEKTAQLLKFILL